MVLTYHSVGPTPLAVSTNAFREQMAWLKTHAAVVPLDRLIEGNWPKSSSGLVCSITFDDGYASVYRHAYPVLKDFGFPATVYLVAGAMAVETPHSSNDFDGLYPDEEMMLWRETKELQAQGIRMGSHLVAHKDLTSLDTATADEELLRSKQLIEERLGEECSSFCYPWGRHDDKSVEAVRRAGYRNAVVAIQGRWKGNGSDCYRIPRADVRRDYTIDDFAAVVKGDWDFLGYVQKIRRMFG